MPTTLSRFVQPSKWSKVKKPKVRTAADRLAALDPALEAIESALEPALRRQLLLALGASGELVAQNLETLRAAGGKGSGNFGHAGRPGEVGGSRPNLEDGPNFGMAEIPVKSGPGFSSTLSQKAVVIPRTQKYDITKVGDRRFLYNTKTGTMVFGANDTRAADEWAHSLALEAALENSGPQSPLDRDYDRYDLRGYVFAGRDNQAPEVVSYNMPGNRFDDPERFEALSLLVEHLVKNGAKPDMVVTGPDGERGAIQKVWPEFRKQLPKAASARLRAAVAYVDAFVAAGGPGSGNFGHAGRPGEVGGSAAGYGQDADFRKARLRSHVLYVATRMNYDPDKISVVDIDPRPFTLNGQTLREAGHYDPRTAEIEVNARNMVSGGTRGVVAHEISHAQLDMVHKLMDSTEAFEIDKLRREDPVEFKRLFFTTGKPKKSAMEEVERRWPATALLGKYYGYNARGGIDTLNWKTPQPLMSQLIADDGHTDYSKEYWQAFETRNPSHDQYLHEITKARAFNRAINETLAEVTRLDVIPESRVGSDRRPSQAWLNYRKAVLEVYEKTRDKHEQTRNHPIWKALPGAG